MVFTKLSSSPPFFQSQVSLFLLTLHRSTYQVCATQLLLLQHPPISLIEGGGWGEGLTMLQQC